MMAKLTKVERSAGGKKAAATRKTHEAKSSVAGKKAAATRKTHEAKRSAAGKKAAATRKANEAKGFTEEAKAELGKLRAGNLRDPDRFRAQNPTDVVASPAKAVAKKTQNVAK